MSVNGQDSARNVYLLDGTLQNDFTNGPAGSAAGTALGIETRPRVPRRDQRLRRRVRPQLRRSDQRAHQVGQQPVRGSAYEYHRNDALDARNYFDVAGKPDFTRNQFGGTRRAGRSAPIGCSSSAATKGCARTSARRSRRFVPDDNARQGLLPDRTGEFVPVGVNAAVAAVPRRVSSSPTGRRWARASRRTPSSSTRRSTRTSRRAASTTTPAPRTSSSPATRSTMPTSGCRPTTRSSRARSCRATSSSRASTSSVISTDRAQQRAPRLQPHAHRAERRGEPRPAAGAVRARARARRRHRHRRPAALRPAELARTCGWCRTCSAAQYDITRREAGTC